LESASGLRGGRSDVVYSAFFDGSSQEAASMRSHVAEKLSSEVLQGNGSGREDSAPGTSISCR
jgi:hypothetical protein